MNRRSNNLMHTVYWHHADAPYEHSSISLVPSSTPGVVGRIGSFGSNQDRAYVLPFAFRVEAQPAVRNTTTVERNTHPRQTSTTRSLILEQNRGLERLKKEIYNPGAQRVSLYYRDADFRAKYSRETNNKEDGKRCAVCLDDFEPGEMVTLTPCHHMFHENCIVPWVTSNGHCPVCRFVISDDRSKECALYNAQRRRLG